VKRLFVLPVALVVGLTWAALLAAACGGPQSTATPTPARISANPEPGASWLYVALGDSLPAGYGAGSSYVDYYAEYIEADLGVKVTAHNWAEGGETTGSLLGKIRQNQGLREDIRKAQVITIWIGGNDIFWEDCIKGDAVDMECIRTPVTRLEQNIDAILAQILSLTSTTRTLILIANIAIPNHVFDDWQTRGLFDELKGPAFEDWSNYMVQAATNQNISVVDSYRALNGPNGDQKLSEEYMQADGIHPNEIGHRFLADLHRQVGYEFTVP
jgi:lysophospholipase L1-like esterase